jgi:hypothetical protein
MTISKKTLAIVLALVLAVAVMGYFALFSPKASEVSFTLAQASLASMQNESVQGVVVPAESGRSVVIEIAGDGGWSEIARTTTDSAGTFKVAFPMTARGPHKVRVRVDAKGRHKAVTTAAKAVRVLEPTQLEAQIPKYARTDRPLKVSGRVSPASSRTVHLETSPDGQTWSPAGAGKSDATSGQYTLRANGLAPGALQVRVTVENSDTAASTVSETQTVSVEDYKAAGSRYLAIVEPVNRLLDQYNALSDTDFTGFKALVPKLSKAETVQARQFRAYAYWPREVQGYIALLVKMDILDADYWNLSAHSKNWADANSISAPDLPKGADNAAALTREALGLPKRD